LDRAGLLLAEQDRCERATAVAKDVDHVVGDPMVRLAGILVPAGRTSEVLEDRGKRVGGPEVRSVRYVRQGNPLDFGLAELASVEMEDPTRPSRPTWRPNLPGERAGVPRCAGRLSGSIPSSGFAQSGSSPYSVAVGSKVCCASPGCSRLSSDSSPQRGSVGSEMRCGAPRCAAISGPSLRRWDPRWVVSSSPPVIL
jgi:hypothetical protein